MTEAEVLFLIALLILALVLTISGFVLKRSILAYAGAGSWVLVALFAYTNRGVEFDIYWALFILSSALAVTSVFVPIGFKEAAGGEEELDEDEADLRQFHEEMRRERERHNYIYGGRRTRRRPPPRRTSSLYR